MVNVLVTDCFCSTEAPDRFISTAIRCCLTGQPIHIHQDKYADFISVQDLCAIVRRCLDARPYSADINCVYPEKLKLSEIAAKIRWLTKTGMDDGLERMIEDMR